jgi:hypothetical protein
MFNPQDLKSIGLQRLPVAGQSHEHQAEQLGVMEVGSSVD